MFRNAFHLVEMSPWPILSAGGALMLTSGLIFFMHSNSSFILIISLFYLLLVMAQWWRDVIRESTFMGYHTKPVIKGLRLGMCLFIVSEVCFFFAFFWAYFHSSLAPVPEIGCTWPPVGIQPLNPFEVPLLNTAVLLASGVTITWCHHSIMAGHLKESILSLMLTSMLGLYFTLLQVNEYYEASFTIADGIYGSCFYVATGFHGLHVIIGTTFLLVCLWRLWDQHFSTGHHFGFEAAAWYWHFVDVVWLFLYISIYCWGK
uniref:Cytochrome c oxidase subunit 3 n=1 Tax=Graptacme eborea TaxID=55752 RepID=Q68SQ3_GRAEB|nr:cytochrome c oxidase subunit III [Graptacme eborea]AAT98395.1 cytochrome c oxidase subunit III [Graptacme eborea]